jgi:Uncharacterized protein conserved in archaea
MGTKATEPKKHLKTIGWKEVIDFPEWGIESLLAKADTGARGSALDVSSIERISETQVKFKVVLDRKNRNNGREVTAQIVRSTRIRSSNGVVQERFIVRTPIRIGKVMHEVDFSLVNRQRMICRVLLGRHALAGHFLVDSDEKYLHGPRKKPRALKKKKS